MSPSLDRLMRASADLVQASIAANTRRAYEAALRQFKHSEYPETDSGIAAYLTGLYEQGRSAACAAMAVAALRFRARLVGRPSPVGTAAMRVLAGFRRLAQGRGRGKVTGVRWEQADRVAEMAEQRGDLAGLRDAAIIAVASDALLRVSEVAALNVPDVNLTEQTVLIRRGKTDQEGKGAVMFLGKPTTERIRAWLDNSRLTDRGTIPRRQQSGSGAARASYGQEHPTNYHPAVQGCRGGRSGQRAQPPCRQRTEPGERWRLPGRDADRRALAFTGDAGALRARATGKARRRGKAPVWLRVRPRTTRNEDDPSLNQSEFAATSFVRISVPMLSAIRAGDAFADSHTRCAKQTVVCTCVCPQL